MIPTVTILNGDWIEQLRTLADESVQCVVTSPPYFSLRDYGVAGQFGLEKTPADYVEKMVEGFREIRRVLRGDGTVWLNLGDSYAGGGNYRGNGGARGVSQLLGAKNTPGLKPKDLIGIPWRCAFALQADGWWLRQDNIWHKPNPMPESVTDRCTKAHEYLFLLTKSATYFYDADAIKEKATTFDDRPWGIQREAAYDYDSKEKLLRPEKKRGKDHPLNSGSNGTSWNGHSGNTNANGEPIGGEFRNKRSVWSVNPSPYPEAHFATFPPDLIKPCILAGTSAHGCCPTCGAPWERLTESVAATSKECPKTQTAHQARGGTGTPVGTVGKSGSGRINGYSKTLGWKPTCQHDDSPVPCTVLDPFFGSGTSGQVSLELGRNCIGIELNPEYVKLAENRCNVTPGMAL